MTDEVVVYEPQAVSPPPGGPGEGLSTMLIPGESLIGWAMQHRFYALLHRRDVAAATTGRFIFMKRPLFGGYVPTDVRWQDLKDAQITVGMFSATVTLTYAANLSDTARGEGGLTRLIARGLKKDAAQGLYRHCQAEEQVWREKRRVRSIEEMRAQSGGVQVATAIYPQPGRAKLIDHDGGVPESPAQRLGRAREMLDQGLISDSEYEAIKAKIVGAL